MHFFTLARMRKKVNLNNIVVVRRVNYIIVVLRAFECFSAHFPFHLRAFSHSAARVLVLLGNGPLS